MGRAIRCNLFGAKAPEKDFHFYPSRGKNKKETTRY
jgi:hypothetical protein